MACVGSSNDRVLTLSFVVGMVCNSRMFFCKHGFVSWNRAGCPRDVCIKTGTSHLDATLSRETPSPFPVVPDYFRCVWLDTSDKVMFSTGYFV